MIVQDRSPDLIPLWVSDPGHDDLVAVKRVLGDCLTRFLTFAFDARGINVIDRAVLEYPKHP